MTPGTLRCGLALSVLLSACATTQRAGSGSDDLMFHVENNLAPPTAVWIWLVPEDGDERTLGGAEPSSTKFWRVEHDGTTTRCRLVARTASGMTITSRPFETGPTEVVEWDVALNSVTTSRGSQGGPLDALQPPRRRIAGAAHTLPGRVGIAGASWRAVEGKR